LIGGLALLLSGMLYGGVYGAFILDNLMQDRSDQLRFAIIYAARGQEEEGEQSVEEMAAMDEVLEVLGSCHAHLTLFGLIALALARSRVMIFCSSSFCASKVSWLPPRTRSLFKVTTARIC